MNKRFLKVLTFSFLSCGLLLSMACKEEKLPIYSSNEDTTYIPPIDTTDQGSSEDKDTSAPKKDPVIFDVLQFNIWHEGTQVSNGYDLIVDEVARYQADFVTFSEVRNYNNMQFLDRLKDDLAEKGLTYYSENSYNVGVLSKYPLVEFKDYNSSFCKVVVKIDSLELAVYSIHPDYTHYAEYLPRGFDGDGNALSDGPVTDVNEILRVSDQSNRPEEFDNFLDAAEKDIEKNRMVILGGGL